MRLTRHDSLNPRRNVLLLVVASFVVLALLTVFAVKIADNQTSSKRDVETRVHERAVLAAALLDSLFNTVGQQIPHDAVLYGTPTVSPRLLDAHKATNRYLIVLDSSGRVIAASSGFTPQARADLAESAALRLVRAGHTYGLGNVLPYGSTGVINFAVRVPTKSGLRYVINGFSPTALSSFITGELEKVPGVSGAHNYLIDDSDHVIASTNPAVPAGTVLSKPGQVAALRHASGTVNGHYYDQVYLANSTEKVVLSAPTGPLFASVSGLHKWLPWVIFIALALTAAVALVLGQRMIRAAEQVRGANIRLARANQELESANTVLERRAAELARSNGELEQFASIASHDLQEPLRKVRTFTQRLSETESERLTERGVDYLERANRAAERMQGLIEDLLKFSRVATHGRSFEDVDLRETVAEVLDDLEGQLDHAGGTVEVGALPIVHADPVQMRQLVQNLISNAVKFHDPELAPVVRVSGEVVDGHAHVTLADNGIGFDPRYADRIFRVFERLNGRGEYGGTGIGLALCRKIADRHGGTVYAESREGDGATFTVVLPHGRMPSADKAEAQVHAVA